METKQRYGTPAQLDVIVEAQRAAFADEAVVRWVTAGMESPEDFGPEFVGQMVREALELDQVLLAVDATGRIVGVSIWQSLDSAERPAKQAAELSALAVPGLERVTALTRLVAEHHPDKPHLYLASMGVVPECRGKGVGSAMLRHRLAIADTDGQPAYLEASTPDSRDLYARHGFTRHRPDIALPDDGPRLHPMWREPAAAAD